MSQTVAVPLWLLLLLGAAALIAVSGWLLLAIRWYFARKARGVLADLGVRLNIELPAFKLTRRRVLIDRLLSDPRVLAAVDAHAATSGVARAEVMRSVSRYAREIVPAFNAYAYFRIGYWIAKSFARLVYRVRLGQTDAASLAAINPKSTVVFVMNHRSNMDYILVSFLAAERVALSYAVGEWARIWPLQGLIRAMGAYFVRRNSGDPLYRMVLQRYVQMATEGGVPQAMYPEGGLTIDGHLRPPKLGLLDYMLKGWNPDGERDLVFVPVGINYDRVIEDRSLLRKLDPTPPRAGLARNAAITLRYLARQSVRTLLGRRYRFGYACVNFGEPISMREHTAARGLDFRVIGDEPRREAVAAVGARLMTAIGRIVPVLPVPLVARMFCRAPERAWSELELKAAVEREIERLEGLSAPLYVPRSDRDYALSVGLRMLTVRGLVLERDGLYRAAPTQLPVLAYYANSIAQWNDESLGPA